MDTSKGASGMFNAYYYAHDCGEPYQRSDVWLALFNAFAERIVREFQPRTVLDAGCAMGFLVEALRQRGVEAWGVDLSEYAIQNVHPSVKTYCWVGSVTDPLPRKYDLIVSIEVLEHLPKSDVERAIANLCQHSEDILFSSTPFDYKEATHINVQPPEYWAEQFARQGFFHDVDFDASYITPWAARFRRCVDPLPRIVYKYERRFWPVWKENYDLRDSLIKARIQLEKNEQRLADQEQKIEALQQDAASKEREVQERDSQLLRMARNPAWRFLKRLARWVGKDLD